MNYLVFEAGGRAGLSAELFFVNRVNKDDGNSLVLADMDTTYPLCPAPAGVIRVSEAEALAMIARDASGCTVSPVRGRKLVLQQTRHEQPSGSSHERLHDPDPGNFLPGRRFHAAEHDVGRQPRRRKAG